MIPQNEIPLEIFEALVDSPEYRLPSKDFKLRQDMRVANYVDELEAVKQACYIICSVERGVYPSFSVDTGLELWDLYGEDTEMVEILLPERIEEALEQDDRITSATVEEIKLIHRNKFKINVLVETIFEQPLYIEREVYVG